MSDVDVARLRRYYAARKMIDAYASTVDYLPKVLELDCRGGAGRYYLPLDIEYIGVSSTGGVYGNAAKGMKQILSKSAIETGDLPRAQDVVIFMYVGTNRSKDMLKVTRAAQCVIPSGFCIFAGEEMTEEYINNITPAFFKESFVSKAEDQLFCLTRGPKNV